MIPLYLLGLRRSRLQTLAGVIVSALGALAGCSRFTILRKIRWAKTGTARCVYLIIFPTGFVLVQCTPKDCLWDCLWLFGDAETETVAYVALLAAGAISHAGRRYFVDRAF